MKRMVKNGDLIDVKPNGDIGIKGNAQVGGRLQVKSSIISTGEIRGGDISGTKFLLGTEEMPLVKANPAGEATGTLEKIKIGDVAYSVGGGSNDRELILNASVDSSTSNQVIIYLDDDKYNKINDLYYETIKIYYSDGKPLGVFHVLNYNASGYNSSFYGFVIESRTQTSYSAWYGNNVNYRFFGKLYLSHDSTGKFISITYINTSIPDLQQSRFDALYKLADKPTQDGTYVLKATVSGGAVTYTWVAQ